VGPLSFVAMSAHQLSWRVKRDTKPAGITNQNEPLSLLCVRAESTSSLSRQRKLQPSFRNTDGGLSRDKPRLESLFDGAPNRENKAAIQQRAEPNVSSFVSSALVLFSTSLAPSQIFPRNYESVRLTNFSS
jgi:hypothetical protein